MQDCAWHIKGGSSFAIRNPWVSFVWPILIRLGYSFLIRYLLGIYNLFNLFSAPKDSDLVRSSTYKENKSNQFQTSTACEFIIAYNCCFKYKCRFKSTHCRRLFFFQLLNSCSTLPINNVSLVRVNKFPPAAFQMASIWKDFSIEKHQ